MAGCYEAGKQVVASNVNIRAARVLPSSFSGSIGAQGKVPGHIAPLRTDLHKFRAIIASIPS